MENKCFNEYLTSGFNINDHLLANGAAVTMKDVDKYVGSNNLISVFISTKGSKVNDNDRLQLAMILDLTKPPLYDEFARIWKNYKQQPEELSKALLDFQDAVIGASFKETSSAQKAVDLGTMFFDEVGRCLSLLWLSNKVKNEGNVSSDNDSPSIAKQAARAITSVAIASLLCTALGMSGAMLPDGNSKLVGNIIDKIMISRLKSLGQKIKKQAQNGA